MKTIVRFFLKSHAISLDVPLPDNLNLAQYMHIVRTDGFLVTTDFFVPYDQINLVLTYQAEQPAGKVMPFTVVPPSPEKPA